MKAERLTTSPTEADLEAAIGPTLRRVFPWLASGALHHQTKFAISFGRTRFDVDGVAAFRKEGRADVIVQHGERALAVLELKRPGVALGPDDEAQGLSYAKALTPSPPLVIVTNGDEVRLLATHTGLPLPAASTTEAGFGALVAAAARAASGDLKDAIETLMGSAPQVWRPAIEQVTDATLLDMTASDKGPNLPFEPGFLLPRRATVAVAGLLQGDARLVIVEGAPMIGKSNVLRDLVRLTRTRDDHVTFLVEASGAGIVQGIADALAARLAWPVTREEARGWLMRVSKAEGPSLVLAVEGLDPDHGDARREVEDLTSGAFGAGLRVVVALDDAVVDRLTVGSTGRTPSPIGRRATRVPVGYLDDGEFAIARRNLAAQRIEFMKGAQTSRELRHPWVLRTLRADFVRSPEHADERLVALLPPLLSMGLIAQTRARFTDPELRRLMREVARAVLDDARDRGRAASLVLEALGIYVFRRRALAKRLDPREIGGLVRQGYLRPAIHRSGDDVLVARLPELVASELADILAMELAPMSRSDPEGAARWLAGAASNLPLGDVVCAHAILDASHGHGGVSFEFVAALMERAPRRESIEPGAHYAMHLPNAGMVECIVQEDGSMVVDSEAGRRLIEVDPEEGPGSIYSDFHSWLVLSHLAGQPFAAEVSGSMERVDPYVLLEVGGAPMVLRQPGADPRFDAILTHDVRGVGSVVCHHAGIVEAVTLSILNYLVDEGPDATSWVEEACGRRSLPLLARVHVALLQIAGMVDGTAAAWAREMLDGPLAAAFADLPALHPEAGGEAVSP